MNLKLRNFEEKNGFLNFSKTKNLVLAKNRRPSAFTFAILSPFEDVRKVVKFSNIQNKVTLLRSDNLSKIH